MCTTLNSLFIYYIIYIGVSTYMCGYTGCVGLSYIKSVCIPQPGHRYAAGMLGRRGRGYPRSDGRA